MDRSLQERSSSLDLVRLAGCVLVILVHAASNAAFTPHDETDRFWGSFFGSMARPAVPIFFILSGMLLLPLKVDSTTFLKRRLFRIGFPLMVWAVVYVLVDNLEHRKTVASLLSDLVGITVNFPLSGLHLWYLYDMVGLYLFMPVLSPWIAQTGRKGELAFLGVWGFSLLLPFLRLGAVRLWGEAYWNDFGALYAFSGYIGYLVLGHWLTRPEVVGFRWLKPVAAVLLVGGFLATWGGQEIHYLWKKGALADPLWSFSALNVAVMAGAVVVLLRGLDPRRPWLRLLLAELAEKSFGIFLVHYALVYPIAGWLAQAGVPAWGAIPLNVALTFLLSYAIARVLWFLPFRRVLFG